MTLDLLRGVVRIIHNTVKLDYNELGNDEFVAITNIFYIELVNLVHKLTWL
jgi:hypothetical protein